MPKVLINLGTEANDGGGDPLRVAGQKMNENVSELFDGLAATETTVQLNARDTANRNRINHSGTQPTSTIEGFTAAAAAAAPVQSIAGRSGAVTLTKADVGLGNVNNTADAAKPISAATQAALDLKLDTEAIFNFEPTGALNARDTANRARDNHFGAQAIDTVTGLQAALNNKIESGAIASFETTAQLNARDTANRARANHTGTQPASTITGLATVATSGAYSALSGRPTIPFGFTHDQQAEPVGPANGATWRERDSGGLIVGQYEWIAANSEWVSLITYQIDSLVVLGSGTAGGTGLVGFSTRKRYIVSSTMQAFYFSGSAIDAANSYTYTPQISPFNGGSVVHLPAATLNSSTLDSTAQVNSIWNFGQLVVFRAATGSPGNSRYVVSLKVRDVRP